MKAFIFDMDGVIVDSEPIHFRLIKKMYSKYGKNFTHDDHNKVVGMSYLEIWNKFITEHNIPAEKEHLHEEHTANLLAEIRTSDEVKISKGIIEFINELYSKGVKLAVASSSNKVMINAVLERFSIKDKFDAIISGEELPKSKPHPAIFQKALNDLKASPNEALIVEDSSNGIKAAKAAGVKCLAFLNNGSNKQNTDEADFKFNCFSELNYLKIREILHKTASHSSQFS